MEKRKQIWLSQGLTILVQIAVVAYREAQAKNAIEKAWLEIEGMPKRLQQR